MKKLLFVVLSAACAALLFSCGGNTSLPQTEPDDTAVIAEIDYATVVTDALNYSQPAAKEAGIEFTNSLVIPKINADGADDFNKKIYDKYSQIYEDIKNGGNGWLYEINYTFSVNDDMIFIVISNTYGPWASEWSRKQDCYCFDLRNLREISADEYEKHFSINRAELEERLAAEIAKENLELESVRLDGISAVDNDRLCVYYTLCAYTTHCDHMIFER